MSGPGTIASAPIRSLPIERALADEAAMLADAAADHSAAKVVIWETEPCLVAPGAMRRHSRFDHARAVLEAAGWPVHLRTTGGDVTPQGPGIVNVSLVWCVAADGTPAIAATYDALCAPILDTLAHFGLSGSRGFLPGAFCDGAHNINISGKKFAGTAQRWKRSRVDERDFAVLAHALLLIEPPAPDAIAALNAFYDACGMSKRVRSSAHTGLLDVVAPANGRQIRTAFLDELHTRYRSIRTVRRGSGDSIGHGKRKEIRRCLNTSTGSSNSP